MGGGCAPTAPPLPIPRRFPSPPDAETGAQPSRCSRRAGRMRGRPGGRGPAFSGERSGAARTPRSRPAPPLPGTGGRRSQPAPSPAPPPLLVPPRHEVERPRPGMLRGRQPGARAAAAEPLRAPAALQPPGESQGRGVRPPGRPSSPPPPPPSARPPRRTGCRAASCGWRGLRAAGAL